MIPAALLDSVQNCDALDLLKRLPDGSVDAIITDPPYGVGKVSARRSPNERFTEIEGNNQILGEWVIDAFRVIRNGGAMYVFANWQNVADWKALISGAGFQIRNQIVWDKLIHGLADIETCFAPRYELILFSARGRHILQGKRPSDVIRHQRVDPKMLMHPYEKPIGLIEFLLSKSTVESEIVVDPFGGSGTTAVAAKRLGRHYVTGDISAAYCDLMRKRLAQPYTLPMFAD